MIPISGWDDAQTDLKVYDDPFRWWDIRKLKQWVGSSTDEQLALNQRVCEFESRPTLQRDASDNGSTDALHASGRGSNPRRSTKGLDGRSKQPHAT